ncbi:hypothetical protein CAEBREN_17183 [Caenorhabditis brenneri]|uniref:Uncharacterized protein n=1 Tax=Caenorhabditis brenneri TaxID=135651 RepID=G0MET4_CAEBE|nr:hypothetical protein CAEBREN_17183 [Caenorhabditis brenneri]
MYGDLVIFIFIATFIHLVIGCKKKPKDVPPKTTLSENSKEKPLGKTPPSSGSTGEGSKLPKPNEPKMAPREANDNETINDAKSEWGELPK